MELPYDYIVFYIMKKLKDRKRELKISRDTLYLYINELINAMDLDEEQEEEVRDVFDVDVVIDNLIDNYFNYFEYDDEVLTFNKRYINFIEEEEEQLINDYDEEILENIIDIIEENVIFLNILNIEVKTELYDVLLDVENKIEQLYYTFACDEEDSLYDHHIMNTDECKTIEKIKKLTIMKRIALFDILNVLEYTEYEDLVSYGYSLCDEVFDWYIPVANEHQKEEINEDINNNPFKRSIFFVNEVSHYNLYRKMIENVDTGCSLEEETVEEKNFYLTFLYFLEEEIKNNKNTCFYESLLISKYRLMNSLDTICNTVTFIDNRDYDNVERFRKDKKNYDFIVDFIYLLIHDILAFDGNDSYNNNLSSQNNYLCNLLKSLFVKTYYYLTDDKLVIDTICTDEKYGNNKLNSRLLDKAVNDVNIKKRIKEKE